ncbi:hypothetical protein [Granulosicoccus antarcticus]|uniref:Uncharacterized protein n=1 Tax=Granulosicoccus antarcticus IMCC3135 TaxID=1192854 RepID=A0A2Z2P068_9GAMM|nr:hypothetical protein [Granulosicoccus antarcticus]ASJ75631.1 hypothetical protein IMCC3135_27890 [Granulosicoccus antarcticus IMCC3135]
MMVDTPISLLIYLVGATLLGAFMGYCIAVLRTKGRAGRAINGMRSELARKQTTAETELLSVQAMLADQRGTQVRATEQAHKALKREAALELHSQLQAQRIQTLESQVSSYEEQQIRLKRDFASYKSNKSRELELAKNKPDAWSGINELPVLQKRIVEPVAKRGTQSPAPRSRADGSSRVSPRNPNGLSSPLSRELDIPALAESELPDSVDELKFELADLDASGEQSRG